MSLRCTRSGLRAVVVLLALLTAALSAVAGADVRAPGDRHPAALASRSTPALSLLDQTPQVLQPGSGPSGASPLSLELAFGPSVPESAVVEVSLYHKLTSRSAFAQTLENSPADPIDRTSLGRQQLVAGPHGGSTFTTDVLATPGACGAPGSLDLACASPPGGFAGVYPLTVSVSGGAGGSVLGRFTTYLTYAGTNPGQPLRVALVLPVVAPVTVRHSTDPPGSAVQPLSAAAAGRVRALIGSLSQVPSVPLTLEPSPQTLQALAARPNLADKLALGDLRQLSAEQHLHETPAQPYVPIDLGALAAAGVGTEIQAQFKQGASVLRFLDITATTPASGTWVADGPVGPSMGSGLAQLAQTLGAPGMHLVLPESSLTLPAQSLTWAETFSLGLGRAETVEAAEADSALSAHFESVPGDPALEAQELLADLAVVQSEQPNGAPRGMVVLPPAGWSPSSGFLSELLTGLSSDPVLAPVTLDDFFAQVSPFSPSASGSGVRLASSGGPTLPAGLPQELSAGRLRLTGWDSAIPQSQPILTQLDQLLLASECSRLRAQAQRARVSWFNRALDHQLGLIQIASERTVTLTARTGLLPVTLLSSFPYPVRGTLTLTSSKLLFPASSSQRLVLTRSTNSVRIPVEVRTSGDLPVTVVFSSPQEGLTISRAQLTIRSTATSVVGVGLTGAAVAVLLAWWARSIWAGRRRRRAAATREGRP